ncbi:MAG TPA: hypothetical protein VMD03_01405 [Steroidobacteraceae bacterium]|nr:hypothetical protein [Steroidobacteraceae bacterium]
MGAKRGQLRGAHLLGEGAHVSERLLVSRRLVLQQVLQLSVLGPECPITLSGELLRAAFRLRSFCPANLLQRAFRRLFELRQGMASKTLFEAELRPTLRTDDGSVRGQK